ncbi:unnamed protein product [Prunus armeniaca]|uniref:Uncharacterized protein n=1 Tax=Prunus armeniaca TaxID=36596 RepID=A0A6J5TXT0_PRUAR|nr:unnamed protein product [Prunus armeniaca]
MFISSAASYALCQPTAFSFMADRVVQDMKVMRDSRDASGSLFQTIPKLRKRIWSIIMLNILLCDVNLFIAEFLWSHHGFNVRLAEIVFHFEALSAEHNDGYLERGQLHGLSGTVTIVGCMGLRSLSCHRLLTCHYLCLMNTRSECTFGDVKDPNMLV